MFRLLLSREWETLREDKRVWEVGRGLVEASVILWQWYFRCAALDFCWGIKEMWFSSWILKVFSNNLTSDQSPAVDNVLHLLSSLRRNLQLRWSRSRVATDSCGVLLSRLPRMLEDCIWRDLRRPAKFLRKELRGEDQHNRFDIWNESCFTASREPRNENLSHQIFVFGKIKMIRSKVVLALKPRRSGRCA